MTIRVMLVDDHRMFREALRAPLEAESDMEIVAEANSGADTLASLDLACPDVLVLDIGLPDLNGIEVARTAIRRHPDLRIVALSGFADRIYIEEMLKAGAHGYVVKSSGADELVSAIRAVAGGSSFLSPEATQVMLRHIQSDADTVAPPPSVLGKREREVLVLLAGGLRSAEIAASLGIAVGTVEVHRRNIKQKLGMNRTADLIRYAVHEGLIPS
ncbi:response regulator [Paramagnetospirillum magneticum]|uniref:Response regulator containing a CheY-like receiver domain and an HTH DNA-binding domain n=1 Tax=Paramagnetospirillum magneticum (strain ATCC 700264 / AMB-1) TaxID=342108 RepID=Q2W107_PARM1|nr:response regulator transcription factor [Paramagnetospirillum magneticum]BAE52468.1 Response regulator containing a CheY-like receiver domain and an HTH DNA-binding domain [Paramagnetospirillum magneticum AMB-1]